LCNSLQLLELDALVEFGLAFVAFGEKVEADALDVLAGLEGFATCLRLSEVVRG